MPFIAADAASHRETVDIVQLDELKIVKKRLLGWAWDWSHGDAEAFIGYYTDNYPFEAGKSAKIAVRNSWKKQRRQRIKPERNIQIEVLIKNIFFTQKQHISVIFEQNYSSNSYRDRVTKKITWKKIAGEWYIELENVLK